MRPSALLLFPFVGFVVVACGTSSGSVLSSNDAGGGPGFPPGTVNCTDGPNYTGCACKPGDAHACYTGPAETRGVGACKDGTQTCVAQGGEVSAYAFGPCTGEIVPSENASCGGGDGGAPDGPPAGNGEAGKECGGFAGLQCASDEYCGGFPTNDPCGGGDSFGFCFKIPAGCTADCPGVCGCDNKTYCNDCVAAQAGAAVKKTGKCN